MSFETAQQEIARRRSCESAAERAAEIREAKEKEMDPEAQAAATLERADFLVKEVKQGKQQMQNIVIHMQQVMQAIQAIRQQLQLVHSDDPSSVVQDKVQIEKLQAKIKTHKDEILKMKEELIAAQVEQMKEGQGVGVSDQELRAKAQTMVEQVIAEIENV